MIHAESAPVFQPVKAWLPFLLGLSVIVLIVPGVAREAKSEQDKPSPSPGLAKAFRTPPAATGAPLKNSADLAGALKRFEGETAVLPSGRRHRERPLRPARSAGVPLPALGPGPQQTVSLPVITLQPYSSLAGRHKIRVIFNPNFAGGQPSFGHPATPYILTATFPSDHCRSLTRQPAGPAGSAAPARGGVPPPPSPGMPRR